MTNPGAPAQAAPGDSSVGAQGLDVADAEQLARLLSLLSEPTRIRMLFALVAVDELSVGTLARTLEITSDQAGYGLKILRSAGLVTTRREGRTVHYRLADAFPHTLLEHCMRQLLRIADAGPTSWR